MPAHQNQPEENITNGLSSTAANIRPPALGQFSKEELGAAIALLVNMNEVDTAVHRSRQPNEPIVPRRTSDPSPRHNKCHSPKEQPTRSGDEDDDGKHELAWSKPSCHAAPIAVSHSVDAADKSVHSSKKSYMNRVFSFSGGGVIAEPFTPKRELSNLSSRSKSPFGTVRSTLTSIIPSFFGNSHPSPTSSQDLLCISKQGFVADITAPQSAPNSRQLSRQISRQNSRHNSRQSSPTGSRRAAVGVDAVSPLLGLQLSFPSPLCLQPLVEAPESSLYSDAGQGLSSLSEASVSATGAPSERIPAPPQDSESESASPDIPQPGSAGPFSIPLADAAAPSLRDLLQIGFVLSPRDTPRDGDGDNPCTNFVASDAVQYTPSSKHSKPDDGTS